MIFSVEPEFSMTNDLHLSEEYLKFSIFNSQLIFFLKKLNDSIEKPPDILINSCASNLLEFKKNPQ